MPIFVVVIKTIFLRLHNFKQLRVNGYNEKSVVANGLEKLNVIFL